MLVPVNIYRLFGEGAEIATSFLASKDISKLINAGWTLQKCIAVYNAGGIHTLCVAASVYRSRQAAALVDDTEGSHQHDRPG